MSLGLIRKHNEQEKQIPPSGSNIWITRSPAATTQKTGNGSNHFALSLKINNFSRQYVRNAPHAASYVTF